MKKARGLFRVLVYTCLYNEIGDAAERAIKEIYGEPARTLARTIWLTEIQQEIKDAVMKADKQRRGYETN